jgi:uncharacterized membrane protein HdeD (DUF308 family)
MTNTVAGGLFHHFWKATLVSGLLTAVLGVLILAWPEQSITVAAVLFGVYLLVSGVAQVIFAFTLPVTAGGRILLFLSGAASVVLAVLAFRHFDYGYAYLLLAIWIAVGFIFRGASTAASAITDPGLPGRGCVIFFGVISFIAGIVVLAKRHLRHCTSRKALNNTITTNLPQSVANAVNGLASQHLSLDHRHRDR